MELDKTESSILNWYAKNWNGRHFISRNPWQLDLDTSLTTGEHPWLIETGEEIMDDYFNTFNVERACFDLYKYWPVEPGWIPGFLLPKSMRVIYAEPASLTLRMMADSAKAGRWLYD